MKNYDHEILALQIRNLIAEREFITAQANNDLAAIGHWQCNYVEPVREIEKEIQELFKQALKEKEEQRFERMKGLLKKQGIHFKP